MRQERRLEQQIRDSLNAKELEVCSEESLQETIEMSKAAFYKKESSKMLTVAEFLYQQGRYIQKRWWMWQVLLLLVLWKFSSYVSNDYYLAKCLGIAAPLFAILILPELWKNRNADAMEVESTAYFSLRQIYAARILLLAMVDLLLLSVFCFVSISSGRILLQDVLIQFFLPYIVSCCICFRCLYSQKIDSEFFSIFLCFVWSGIWTQIVLHEKIFQTIAIPVWYGLLAVALCYLGYCIYRGQKDFEKTWEAKPLWN